MLEEFKNIEYGLWVFLKSAFQPIRSLLSLGQEQFCSELQDVGEHRVLYFAICLDTNSLCSMIFGHCTTKL